MRGRILAISGGIVAVGAGSIVAISVTASSGGTTPKTTAPLAQPVVAASASPSGPAWAVSPSTTPAASPKAAAPKSSAKQAATITYVVKPGDNLSVISAWFSLHGYAALYDANRSVIGADPNLIHPGERITISGGHLTMSSS